MFTRENILIHHPNILESLVTACLLNKHCRFILRGPTHTHPTA